MTDGSSNTMILVSVAPDEAVIWTKPDDWEVDLDNSLKGLKGDQREQVSVALADGSAHRISVTINPKILRLLITKSDGEVVPEKAFGN